MTEPRCAAKSIALYIFSALLLGAAIFTQTVAAHAQSEAAADARPGQAKAGTISPAQNLYDLTGTWVVSIQPNDGTPPFVGYYSFSADGNVSFSSAGPPLPALGNPGYGVWKRVAGNRFAQTIRMNSYTEKFQFDGTLKIMSKIYMTSPDAFATQDTVKVYDRAGNEIVTLGGRSYGRRMKVEE